MFRRDAHVSSFGNADGFDDENGADGSRYLSWLRDRARDLPAGVVHAWRGDRIVGQIEARVRREPPSAYVNLFYLVPEERGTGAGDELHEYILGLLRKEGVLRVELSVAPGNLRAVRYYVKHGWRDLGPRKDLPEVHLMALDLRHPNLADTKRIPLVRHATTEDAEAIGRVHVRAWQAAYRGQVPDQYLDSLDPMTRSRKWRDVIAEGRRTILVSEADGAVVGFCSLAASGDADLAREQVGEITAIYVDPVHWRRGHGRALMEAARVAARASGYERLTLWVLRSNEAARAFYESHGFEADGAEKLDELFGVPLHVVRYRAEVKQG
jgi:ribosomal protein S18 acetylase RimI-like enzyme